MKYFQLKPALLSDFDRRWAFISRNLIRSFSKTNHKMHFNCSRINADLVASPPQGPHCGNELLDIGAVFDILQQDSVKGLRAPVNAWIAYRCQEAVARGYHDAVLLLLQKLLEISGQKGSRAALQRDEARRGTAPQIFHASCDGGACIRESHRRQKSEKRAKSGPMTQPPTATKR